MVQNTVFSQKSFMSMADCNLMKFICIFYLRLSCHGVLVLDSRNILGTIFDSSLALLMWGRIRPKDSSFRGNSAVDFWDALTFLLFKVMSSDLVSFQLYV